MSDRNDGGQAFPSNVRGHGHAPGMTLRDWFAGQALAGMMASEAWPRGRPEDVAGIAYVQADAMLEARKDGDS